MATMIEASQKPEQATDACPAKECLKTRLDKVLPGYRHRLDGAWHVWLGAHSEVVLDCTRSAASVHVDGVVGRIDIPAVSS